MARLKKDTLEQNVETRNIARKKKIALVETSEEVKARNDKSLKAKETVEEVDADVKRKRGRPRTKPVDDKPQTEGKPIYEKFGAVTIPKSAKAVVRSHAVDCDVDEKVCIFLRTNYGNFACLAMLCKTKKCKLRHDNTNEFISIRDKLMRDFHFRDISEKDARWPGFFVVDPEGGR